MVGVWVQFYLSTYGICAFHNCTEDGSIVLAPTGARRGSSKTLARPTVVIFDTGYFHIPGSAASAAIAAGTFVCIKMEATISMLFSHGDFGG